MSTKKAGDWDRVAETWRSAHPQMLWRAHSDAVNVALFDRWLSEGIGRALKTDTFDEAFGDGLYPLLASRARNVVSIDISVPVLRTARAKHGELQPLGSDVRWLPFADGAFDVVVSNSTLDHFESQDEIVASLKEFGRVLRPGGQLLLTLDNLANPIVALRNALPFCLLNRLGIVPYYVGATFGPRRLHRAIERVGFEVECISAVLHCPRVLAVAVAGLVHRRTAPEAQKRFLRLLMIFERLRRWPTCFLTGYFLAIRATRRS